MLPPPKCWDGRCGVPHSVWMMWGIWVKASSASSLRKHYMLSCEHLAQMNQGIMAQAVSTPYWRSHLCAVLDASPRPPPSCEVHGWLSSMRKAEPKWDSWAKARQALFPSDSRKETKLKAGEEWSHKMGGSWVPE